MLNPAGVQRQLIGVYSESLVVPVAEALGELGSKNVMVVHGLDGSDELSITAPSRIAFLREGKVELSTFDPVTIGLDRARIESIAGGDVQQNAQILRDIFSGQPGPRQDIVALNSAAALVVGGKANDLNEGLALARQSLTNGATAKLLELMKENKI
jgi:anthranilate phosphoribosyltransferase